MSTDVGQPGQATRPSGAGVTALPVQFWYVEFYQVTGCAEYIRVPGGDFYAGIIQSLPVPVATGDFNRHVGVSWPGAGSQGFTDAGRGRRGGRRRDQRSQ